MEKKETFYEARVMGKENIYGVAAKRGGIFMLVLQYPSFPEINAGQFIMLEPLSAGSCMPRPFTPFMVEDVRITLAIKNVGRNTDRYSRLWPGDKIKIAGPFGNPFSTVQNHNYILVGGGMGIAALGMIAKYLHSKLSERGRRITILLGAKNAGEIFGFNYFRRFGTVKAVSENENNGKLVIDLLKEELAQAGGYPSIIACGPRAMLKEVTSIASRHNCFCEVIMEEMMACGGQGSCYGCAVFGIDGKAYKVCGDGPVFPAYFIDWKKACPEYVEVIPKPKQKFAIPGKKSPLSLTLVSQLVPRIHLSSPILNASGCLELGAIQGGQIDITRLGALFPKGIELNPSQGNPSPRVCEVEGGMLNSIGLQNVGVDSFIKEYLSKWSKLGKPVFVNISGKTLKEYGAIAERLNKVEVGGVEVNLGCPNIEKGGMLFGQNPRAAYKVVKIVRQKCAKFLIAKLTPNVADIIFLAKAVKEAGADAISIANTVQAMAIDPWTRKSKIAKGLAGMSGPVILPRTVALVFQVAKANIGIPIIAGGGVSNAEDAMQLILAGANAIFCGTASFANPNIFTELYNGLLQFVEYYKVKNLQELVGKVELVK